MYCEGKYGTCGIADSSLAAADTCGTPVEKTSHPERTTAATTRTATHAVVRSGARCSCSRGGASANSFETVGCLYVELIIISLIRTPVAARRHAYGAFKPLHAQKYASRS